MLITWSDFGLQVISPTEPAGSARPSTSTIRTSNAAFTCPDVPGTPSSETVLYAIGNASVIPYIVTTFVAYRCSMLRYRSAEMGAAEMNLSGSCESRGSGG